MLACAYEQWKRRIGRKKWGWTSGGKIGRGNRAGKSGGKIGREDWARTCRLIAHSIESWELDGDEALSAMVPEESLELQPRAQRHIRIAQIDEEVNVRRRSQEQSERLQKDHHH